MSMGDLAIKLSDDLAGAAATLAECATRIERGDLGSPADLAVAIRRAVTVWRTVAAQVPDTLTMAECAIGVRVKVQPFTQCAVTRGSSRPIRLPLSLPATIVDVWPDDAVMAKVDPQLYGFRPWANERQLFVPSYGELHRETCRCVICEYGDLLAR